MKNETLEKIIGHEKILDQYGEWPSFHDSEVLRLVLDRDSESELQGPTITMDIHAFTVTSDVTPMGTYKCINHAIITFKLDGVEEVEIGGFNHQNSIDGLYIDEIGDKSWEHDFFKFELDPSYGVSAEIKCRRIEIISVSAGIPKNSVYEKN